MLIQLLSMFLQLLQLPLQPTSLQCVSVILFDAPLVSDYLLLVVVPTTASPPDLILFVLRNQPDTLQDIGYIVYSTFLNSQLFHGVVQIDTLLGGFLNELDEFFCKLDQAVFLAETFT
jgi:hypothetical protein